MFICIIINYIYTMLFVHMSDKEHINFIEPSLLEYDDRYSLNPKGGLFLSKLNDDSRTDWQDSRSSRDEASHYWQSGYRHIYEVDMSKILIINNAYDLATLFFKYGTKGTPIVNDNIAPLEKEITIILDFLNSLNEDKKGLIEQADIMLEYIEGIKYKYIEVKIKDDMVVIPKQGASLRFICSVFVRLKKLYDKIGKQYETSNMDTRFYETINYIKIRDDNYNGIYYTKNIISYAKASTKMNFIFKDFITWLDADTLIVWKEDALKKID